MKHNIPDTKLNVLNEILIAQKNGYVQRIDIVTLNDCGTIVYDPDAASYGNDAINLNTINLKTIPNFDSVYIYFSSTVNFVAIEKICMYLIQKYNCKCYTNNNRLDIYGFN